MDEFGPWRSLASALAWGARGPGFKSRRPDQPTSDRILGLSASRLVAALMGTLSLAAVAQDASPQRLLGYYPMWAKTQTPPYSAAQIPFGKLTHIAHAFLALKSDGSLSIDPALLEPALISGAHAAGVKVMISIGGADQGQTSGLVGAILLKNPTRCPMDSPGPHGWQWVPAPHTIFRRNVTQPRKWEVINRHQRPFPRSVFKKLKSGPQYFVRLMIKDCAGLGMRKIDWMNDCVADEQQPLARRADLDRNMPRCMSERRDCCNSGMYLLDTVQKHQLVPDSGNIPRSRRTHPSPEVVT